MNTGSNATASRPPHHSSKITTPTPLQAINRRICPIDLPRRRTAKQRLRRTVIPAQIEIHVHIYGNPNISPPTPQIQW